MLDEAVLVVEVAVVVFEDKEAVVVDVLDVDVRVVLREVVDTDVDDVGDGVLMELVVVLLEDDGDGTVLSA